MGNLVQWAGIRQGKLLVTRQVDSSHDGQARWECQCDCGNICIKTGSHLRTGAISCSVKCGVAESNRRRARHGLAHGKEWVAWIAAKQRCNNPKNPKYHNYGGRGIAMLPAWEADFALFYAHIGPAPTQDRHSTLDRIDNERGYEPGNVRWVTMTEQLNNRRQTRWVYLPDRRLALTDAVREYGLPYSTVDSRWRKGVRGLALLVPKKGSVT